MNKIKKKLYYINKKIKNKAYNFKIGKKYVFFNTYKNNKKIATIKFKNIKELNKFLNVLIK